MQLVNVHAQNLLHLLCLLLLHSSIILGPFLFFFSLYLHYEGIDCFREQVQLCLLGMPCMPGLENLCLDLCEVYQSPAACVRVRQ